MNGQSCEQSLKQSFEPRHIGPTPGDQAAMLAELGVSSLEQLAEQVVPADILLPAAAAEQGLPLPCGEAEALAELAAIAASNRVVRSRVCREIGRAHV